MSCVTCGQDLCVCAPLATMIQLPVPYRKYVVAPTGMTKEEFGLSLYETIVTIGGLLGVEQQRAAAIHLGQGSKIAELIVRRERLQRVLAAQLPRLNDSEMKQVLTAYPWVVAV